MIKLSFRPLAFSVVMLAVCGAASAQQAQPTDKTRERARNEVPAVLTAAGLQCDVADAYFIGESKGKTPDGKNTQSRVYEVACNGGSGYLLSHVDNASVTTLNCTQSLAQNATDPNSLKCVLPGNAAHYAWLSPVVQAKAPGCTISDARWLGTVPDQKFDRYEYACADKAGAIIDVPQPGSSYPVTLTSCLAAAGSSSACTLSTPEQINRVLVPEAQKVSASCQVNNARWLGRIAAEDTDFYEIGCANEPGFILATDAGGTFKTSVGCDRAGSLGPCQFTDTAAVEQATKTQLSTTLKTAGYSCTVSDFKVFGTQTNTNRDLIEFQCAEQPFGLMSFIPNPGSTSTADVFDCYSAAGRNRPCELVTQDVLVKNIDALTKAESKDCDVQQVRYVGVADEDAVVVEIACTNKRGYIADVLKSRKGFGAIVSCNIAKNRGYETCTIPGNGTYVSTVGND